MIQSHFTQAKQALTALLVILRLCVFALALSTVSMAQAQEPDEYFPAPALVSDPLESWNRSVFSFNQSLDQRLIKPVATVYRNTLPTPVQTGVGNFFSNMREVWSAVNNVLQFRPDEAFINVTRVGLNSTLGIYGIFDVATLMGVHPLPKRDLGETLGRWGVPSGPYLMLPVLGPSSLRDVTDDIVVGTHPTWSPDQLNEELSVKMLRGVHQRAVLLDATNSLEQMALDPYVMVRDGYMRSRENKLNNKESVFSLELNDQ